MTRRRDICLPSRTIGAISFELVPFAFGIPSAKTLMAGIIPREMAMLYEPVLFMSAEKCDFLVEAHYLD